MNTNTPVGSALRVRDIVKSQGFLLMLAVPWLGPWGLMSGVTWLSPLVIFVAVPLLDALFGDDPTNLDATPAANPLWDLYHRLVPLFYIVSWVGATIWTADAVANRSLQTDELIALLLGQALGSAFATCAAHELVHRRWKIERWATRFAMSVCCYGHFVIEHLHHHRTAGDYDAGTVPHRGESIYSFIPRNIAFGFRNTWRLEEGRRRALGRSIWSNRCLQQHLLSVLIGVGFYAAWGTAGLLVFATQALFAMANVEFIQYFEHYALVRSRGEKISVLDSWNSNGWLTNALTLNITRHSHHHLNAGVPYQRQGVPEGSPMMPMGYFGLAWIAVVPPLWRRIIDPLVPQRGARPAVQRKPDGRVADAA